MPALLTRTDIKRRLNGRHPEYINALIDVFGIESVAVGQSLCIREEDFDRYDLARFRKTEVAAPETTAATA